MVTKKKTKREKFKDKDYYFDDCAICQYVKKIEEKGEPQTDTGLKIAFERQRQKGAVVGGSMFEDDDPSSLKLRRGKDN